MTGFIPEITTTVKVQIHHEDIDNAIDVMQSNEIASSCFDELINILKTKQQELKDLQDPLAEGVAENLQSHQEQIIGMKHHHTGMMMNSVDISQDGDGVYLVGNTATSVDGFPYPLAIETGRREVYPINAKCLRWWNNSGEIVFSKYSSAVAPDPFVQYSVDMTEENIEEIVDEYLNNVLGD